VIIKQRSLVRLLMIVTLAANCMVTASFGAPFPTRSAQPAPVLPECTCRYRGHNVSLGQRICLESPDGPRLAECVLEGNVTSWRQGGESCTLSLSIRRIIGRT
jgi:hypothetical protein